MDRPRIDRSRPVDLERDAPALLEHAKRCAARLPAEWREDAAAAGLEKFLRCFRPGTVGVESYAVLTKAVLHAFIDLSRTRPRLDCGLGTVWRPLSIDVEGSEPAGGETPEGLWLRIEPLVLSLPPRLAFALLAGLATGGGSSQACADLLGVSVPAFKSSRYRMQEMAGDWLGL